MENWKSTEEKEAWWSELQSVKEKTGTLECRMLDITKGLFGLILPVFVSLAPEDRQRYMLMRLDHYNDKFVSCKNEVEIGRVFEEFTKEYMTYLKAFNTVAASGNGHNGTH